MADRGSLRLSRVSDDNKKYTSESKQQEQENGREGGLRLKPYKTTLLSQTLITIRLEIWYETRTKI